MHELNQMNGLPQMETPIITNKTMKVQNKTMFYLLIGALFVTLIASHFIIHHYVQSQVNKKLNK